MASGKFLKPRNNFTQQEEVPQAFDSFEEPAPMDAPALIDEPHPEDVAIEQAFLDMAEEEPEYDFPPFLVRFLAFVNKNRKTVLICSCLILLAVLVGVTAIFWLGAASDPYEGKILNNVIIGNVNVGGMTRSEAEQALKDATNDTFTKQDMVIQLPDTTIRLSPADTKAKLDVKAAVKAAYSFGRTGSAAEQQAAYESSFTGNHTVGLLPYLGLNTDYILNALEDYAAASGSLFSETTYVLEGEMPALDAENFDENAPCQTLVITMGTTGLALDTDGIYNKVLDAYSFNTFLVTGEGISEETIPQELDLDAVYAELCIEPINASMNSTTFEPIPGVYGYGFDLEAAKELVSQAKPGETVKIPMAYIEPEIIEGNLLFRDVLGECKTPHSQEPKRTANLQLACKMLNGVVVNPGETLSYNETVGERTTERGFQPAPAYSGTNLVNSVGGGVCQVSSTLYYCTLLSDLEIVDRVNHGFPSTYIDYGMDATVNWGGPDFKFRNNTNYPIQIEAWEEDGYVHMRILGTDEKDYYVKMEYEVIGFNKPGTTYETHSPDSGYYDGQVLSSGSMGPIAKTYRCKYSKETGELISRDYETRSSYMSTPMVVVKIVGSSTTPPAGEEGGEVTPPAGGEGGEVTPPASGDNGSGDNNGGNATPPTDNNTGGGDTGGNTGSDNPPPSDGGGTPPPSSGGDVTPEG